MKKDFFNKKTLTALCLAVAALVAAAGGTLAIYTNQTYQRSVVRNRDNDVIRFSSDKLYRETNQSGPRNYYYPMGEYQTTMTFQVCNFDQDRSTLIQKNTIEYQVTFQAAHMAQGASCAVFRGDGTSAVITLNDETPQTTDWYSLPGGQRTVDTFKIQLPEHYDGMELTVTVTPKDSTLTQNRILSAVLIPVPYGTVQTFSVQWEFTDSKKEGLTPADFAAYNVLVTAAGSGSVRIRWNESELEIDPFFLQLVKIDPSQVTNEITIPMNSMDDTGSYLITFYKCSNIGEESWDDLKKNKYVDVSKVETQ